MADPEASVWQRIFGPILSVFESVGMTVGLTFQTVAWLFRPPFRVNQMLAAMDYMTPMGRAKFEP
ncbi:MAG TPA: hypothetical protein PKA58_31415, partial [Polyangium sp.]|nr:hypothetical protein [Polyangium sp.]